MSIESSADNKHLFELHRSRYSNMSQIAFFFATLFHLAQIPLFLFLQIPFLALFNIGSTILFTIALFLSKKGYSRILVSVTLSEVVLHQYLVTHFIGWQAGYAHLILFAVILPTFSPHGGRIWKTVMVSAAISAYVFIAFASPHWNLWHPIDQTIVLYLNTVNIFMLAFFLFLMAWSFNRNVLFFEDSLARQNENNHRLLKLNEETTAQLYELNVQLKHLSDIKSDFVSTISHELRTPLTSILGFSQMIRKKCADLLFPQIQTENAKIIRGQTQVIDNLDIIISEGNRLTNLINDVLDIAKMEAGKVDWKSNPVECSEIIHRAVSATASLFEKKNLPCNIEIAPNIPSINADEDRLIQVLINLLSNAVKFTDSGSITVSAQSTETAICLSVTDTGEGIAEENLHAVFEKFVQVGEILSNKPKGTGLGLPICKEIVEHHGGKISVESTIGKGSTFTVEIPFTVPDQSVQTETATISLTQAVTIEVPIIDGNGKTVLVVDDEAAIRSLIRQELEDVGYQVIESHDGLDAIDKVKRYHPDIITLDVMMPNLNGFDLAAILRNDPVTEHIPIIIVSVIEDRDRGIKIGVNHYFSKPINTNGLIGAVGELVTRGTLTKRG